MLDGRAHDGTRPFGPKREFFPVQTIFKRVHLLFDNIGHLSDAAAKKRRRLQNRRANLSVPVACGRLARRRFKALPNGSLIGEHVVHALDTGNFGVSHRLPPLI